MNTEFSFEFPVDGRMVRPGQVMHIAPSHHQLAGASGKVERFYGDTVMLRSDNGAVPTVPVDALSWDAQPVTVAMEELAQAGFTCPTVRDVAIWIAARRGTPVAWLRDQRGTYEGPETLDPLFVLGDERPKFPHGATYSALFDGPQSAQRKTA